MTETLVLAPSGQDNDVVISAPATTPRNVRTEIAYYGEPGSPAPLYITDEKTRLKNVNKFHPATVYDVRGSGVEHTLDVSGIQFVKHESKLSVHEFDDNERIKAAYYAEVEGVLKNVTGASKVKIFHHVVKDVATEKEEKAIPAELEGPVRGTHIDQSYDYAPEVVKKNLPDESERLLKSRFQIINVWRPIKTIFKDPFAVLDARTVLEEELVRVKVIYPTHEFESVNVRGPSEERKEKEGGEGHKWWYMSQQSPEDVLCLKMFDSKTDGRARRVPHSSFTDPEFEDRDARMSIEVRALVFHEDDVE
ncbi:hypothetical protein BGZ57DRAFT_829781 [Hyaloscypha finlandica]|nr:hypothetical protein BGZ57DRAFT_829781 [Hyaloscypha finlandica]